jgi:hypothetical protein
MLHIPRSPLVPLAAAVALFIAGCVAFIYGVTDATLSLALLSSDSAPARLAQIGLGCWAGTVICMGIAAQRFLSRKETKS